MKQTEYNIPVFENEDKADLKDYSEKMAEAIKIQVDKFGNPLTFKGTVSTLTELQNIENTINGDIYAVTEDNKNYIFNGFEWIVYSDSFNLKLLEDKVNEIETKTLPSGGVTGQVLAKASDKDCDTKWINQTSGESITIDQIKTLIDEAILANNKKKYHVGKIIISTNNINPNAYLGFGTWQIWGAGRVPVGVDTSQTEFNTVEKTGGEKTHTLAINEMPSHYHEVGDDKNAFGAGSYPNNRVLAGAGLKTSSAGGGQAHNNLQPYITCYMWKRTA